MTITIIADDLTGACDTGALFCGRGRVAVFIAPAHPGRAWEVAAVDTESRALAPDAAARRMSAVGSRLGGRLAAGVVFNGTSTQRRLAVLTKAGGFGPPDLFVALLRGTRQ